MPTLFLIRHGENDYTKKGKLAGHLPNVHLNKRGRKQAEELAEALKDLPLKAVYSSPLERAQETAALHAWSSRLAAYRKLYTTLLGHNFEVAEDRKGRTGGLADRRQTNTSPGKLSVSQQAEAFEARQKEPPDGGLGSGPKLARYVRDRWGIKVCPETGWRWLTQNPRNNSRIGLGRGT